MTDERPHEETRPASPAAQERILRFQSLGRGALFAGRYEIREPLGSGGAGEVYRATDRTAGADVALKVLFPGSDMRDLDRLRRELRLVRTLQHPGIVRIFDIGESDGLLYMVSELLEGESLADRIRREGAIAHAEAERILRRVLEALAVAHAAGVIHRDIKPANIFLERPGKDGPHRVLLLDFGLARLWGEPGLTATGRFVGTPEYCAPEQALGEKELTPATDLYACGVTLWAMLSGKPPFRGTSEIKILNAHLSTPPPSPRKEMPGAPARLRAFALTCLAKNPSGRPTDATEALVMLDHPLSLRVRGRLFRVLAGRVLGRKTALAAAAAALLAAAGLLGLWLLVPVGVRHEGKQVYWETRGGWELAGPQFQQPVASIRLAEAGLGLFPQAFIGLRGQAVDDGPWRPHPPFPRMIFEVPNIWSSPRPVLAENASRTALETGFYRDFDPAYLPSAMIDLPELERAAARASRSRRGTPCSTRQGSSGPMNPAGSGSPTTTRAGCCGSRASPATGKIL